MSDAKPLPCGDPGEGVVRLGELLTLTHGTGAAGARERRISFGRDRPVLGYTRTGALIVGGAFRAPRHPGIAIGAEEIRDHVRRARARPRAPGYRGTHWGAGGDDDAERLACGDPRDGVVWFGRLMGLAYRTTKWGYPRESDFTHRFESPRPFVGYDRSGALVIGGGGYWISIRGIEG